MPIQNCFYSKKSEANQNATSVANSKANLEAGLKSTLEAISKVIFKAYWEAKKDTTSLSIWKTTCGKYNGHCGDKFKRLF